MGKRLTPAQAIKVECGYCGGRRARSKCGSVDCQLSPMVKHRSHLRRIRAHCYSCVGHSHHRAKACDGKVLNPEPHICPLHPYRTGKNPRLRRAGARPPQGKPFEKKYVGQGALK
jgi:hypothetical protein